MSVPQGQAEWGRILDDLEGATQRSISNPNPQFDAARWQYEQKELSENVQTFLAEQKQQFEGEKFGSEKTRAVLPLYVPRVSMVEAVHVMPPEPRATDAFRYALPDKVEGLKAGGPDWVGLCNTAVQACQAKEERQKQLGQQQQQSKTRQDGAAATAANNSSGGKDQISRRLHRLYNPGKEVDFMPIILLSGGPSALVQMCNVSEFLDRGAYVAPTSCWVNEMGTTNLAERDSSAAVLVSPAKMLSRDPAVKFKMFRVLDDPAKVTNWDHVCACFVTGSDWEFDGWYNNNNNGGRGSKAGQQQQSVDARSIFDVRLKGFLPFFEDEKEPAAIKKWRVVPLQFSRREAKLHVSLRMARIFWESLFAFLETHEKFRDYTLDAPKGLALGSRA